MNQLELLWYMLPDSGIVLATLAEAWMYLFVFFVAAKWFSTKPYGTTIPKFNLRVLLAICAISAGILIAASIGLLPLFGNKDVLIYLAIVLLTAIVYKNTLESTKLRNKYTLFLVVFFYALGIIILEGRGLIGNQHYSKALMQFMLVDMLYKLMLPAIILAYKYHANAMADLAIKAAMPIVYWIEANIFFLSALISLLGAMWIESAYRPAHDTIRQLNSNERPALKPSNILMFLALIAAGIIISALATQNLPQENEQSRRNTHQSPQIHTKAPIKFVLPKQAAKILAPTMQNNTKCKPTNISISPTQAILQFEHFSISIVHKSNQKAQAHPLMNSNTTTAYIESGSIEPNCSKEELKTLLEPVLSKLEWKKLITPPSNTAMEPKPTSKHYRKHKRIQSTSIIGIVVMILLLGISMLIPTGLNIFRSLGYVAVISAVVAGFYSFLEGMEYIENALLGISYAAGVSLFFTKGMRIVHGIVARSIASILAMAVMLIFHHGIALVAAVGIAIELLDISGLLRSKPQPTYSSIEATNLTQTFILTAGISIAIICVIYSVVLVLKPAIPLNRDLSNIHILPIEGKISTPQRMRELAQETCRSHGMTIANAIDIQHSCLSPMNGETEWISICANPIGDGFDMAMGAGITGTLWPRWALVFDSCPRKFVLPEEFDLNTFAWARFVALCKESTQ